MSVCCQLWDFSPFLYHICFIADLKKSSSINVFMTYVDLFFKIIFESLMLKPNFIYFFMHYFQNLKIEFHEFIYFLKFLNFRDVFRCYPYSSYRILSLFFQSYIILILPIIYYPYSSYHILSLFFQSYIILILPIVYYPYSSNRILSLFFQSYIILILPIICYRFSSCHTDD